MASRKKNELVFLPLGGVGEIGMNLGVYGYGPEDNRQWLIVDLGVSFGGPELPGVDLVMPDITFLENERPNILGLVVTHGHGAFPFLSGDAHTGLACCKARSGASFEV